jgi:hypothetical protein
MIVIDPPDKHFSTVEEWKSFLDEMHRAAARTNTLEDGTLVGKWIEVAEGVLKERAGK